MNKPAEYREHAAQCLMLAKRTAEVRDRVALLAIAERWLELAERVRRNQPGDLADFEALGPSSLSDSGGALRAAVGFSLENP